jgi:thioredoxin 1
MKSNFFLVIFSFYVTFAQVASVDDKKFSEIIQQPLVLVDFYASWCVPCKMQEKELIAMQDTLQTKLVIVRLDAEKFYSISKNYAVQYYPTLILFQKGKAIKKWIGLQRKDDLIKEIKPFL